MKKLAFKLLLALVPFGLIQCSNNTAEDTEMNEGEDHTYSESSETGDDNWFTSWDANDDDYLEENEFATGMTNEGLWSDWDNDKDGNNEIDENEWGTGLYNYGDRDGDGVWDQNEWSDFGDDYETNWTWSDWDADGNGELSKTEWDAGWENSGWFDDWDNNADGVLNEKEYYSYNFKVYDNNDDGWLDEDEYDEYEEDWVNL